MAISKVFLCFIVASVSAEKNWYESFIPKDYNPLVAPDGGPIHVDVSLYVISFSHFCTFAKSMSADMYFRQSWVDPRLTRQKTRQESSIIVKKLEEHIWIPDVFIPTAYSVKKFEGESFASINTDGVVLFSQKLSVNFKCTSEDSYFPYDDLMCNLEFESFSMNASRMLIAWKGENAVGMSENGIHFPNVLEFAGRRQSSSILSVSTGEYSRLGLTFAWNRIPSYYVRALLMPLAAFVMLSYTTFYMSSTAPVPRILLGSMTLLCAVVVSAEMKDYQPLTAHFTAADIWCGFCFVFIFGALCESIFVVCVASNVAEEEKSTRIRYILRKISEKSDTVSYVLYPIAFILFVIIYCATYLG